MDKIRLIYETEEVKKLIVIGFGKASYLMAKAVEQAIGNDLITNGIIITKYGHAETQNTDNPPSPPFSKGGMGGIKVFEAGHPVPDENGFKATEEMVSILKNADKDTLVLCLISGGGSALLVSPYYGISIKEKQEITELLLKAGANINELNTVRKHLSKVKGGRLAEIAYPAKMVTLILSDVIEDKLDVIASGPTSPDTTTFSEALDVFRKFDLIEKIPQSTLNVLTNGEKGIIPETPKQDNAVFKNVKNIIIGNNKKALAAAKNKAEELGFYTEIISSDVIGEAKDIGKWLAEKALKIKGSRVQGFKGSKCLISGGETTVTVKGSGLGGRNMELALSFAIEMEGVEGVTLLSAGTDGTDGPTDAAGAIVNGKTIMKAKSLGLDPENYLNNNDSYNFFKKTDSLLITGPTGTNVMDMQILLVE